MTTLDAYKHISIKDAIFHSYMAWEDVIPETIKNCFKQSILFNSNILEAKVEVITEEDKSEFKSLIKRLNLDVEMVDVIDIKEENIIVCDIDDEEIVEMVKNSEADDKYVDSDDGVCDVNDVEITLSNADICEALNHINQAYNILKHDHEIPKNVINSLMSVQKYCYLKNKHAKSDNLLKWITKK